MFDLYREFQSLISALANSHIEYALCGGLAMAVYDHPRATIWSHQRFAPFGIPALRLNGKAESCRLYPAKV